MVLAKANAEVTSIAAKHIDTLASNLSFQNGLGKDAVYESCVNGNAPLLEAILTYATENRK